MSGFSLLEVITTAAIVCLMVAIGVPTYQSFVERSRNARAIGDVAGLGVAIERFRLTHDDRIPNTLDELGKPIPTDPWGREYVFLNIQALKNTGPARKDGKLNPINTDFDLYSLGKDGRSALPLSAKHARDDIVRANNGSFVGLGQDY